MATSTKISNSFLDLIFPTVGTPRVDTPIWDDGRSMFIVNEYVKKENGNRYYTGVRQADRFVINIYIGKFKNWDYLDKVEVYVYDNRQLCLIGHREFNKAFYDEAVVDECAREIMLSYARSEAMMMNVSVCESQLISQIDDFVRRSHFSILDDSGYERLMNTVRLLPADSRRER